MRVSLKQAKRPFNIHAMLRRIRQEVTQFASRDWTRPALLYFGFDLLPAICASVSPLNRKLLQSSIGFAPICL
jgi:hypothetical protein